MTPGNSNEHLTGKVQYIQENQGFIRCQKKVFKKRDVIFFTKDVAVETRRRLQVGCHVMFHIVCDSTRRKVDDGDIVAIVKLLGDHVIADHLVHALKLPPNGLGHGRVDVERLFDGGVEIDQRDVVFHVGEEGHDPFKIVLWFTQKGKKHSHDHLAHLIHNGHGQAHQNKVVVADGNEHVQNHAALLQRKHAHEQLREPVPDVQLCLHLD